MRILIATDTYYPHVNGASYFTQRLARELKKRGHSVGVVAPSRNTANTKEDVAGISVHGTIALPVLFYPGFRISVPFIIKPFIKKTIEEFNPDIIHIQMHFTISRTALSVGRQKKIPVIVTNHFLPENLLPYLPLPMAVKNILGKLAWWDFKRIYNKVHDVTTPTETAKELIKNKVRLPVKAISCGIDLNRFNPKNNGDYLRKKYNIPDKTTFLFVGRLDKDKNIDFVLRAFKQSLQNADSHFIIAGNGAEKNNLIHQTNNLGISQNVTFTGFVSDDDLPNLYALADFAISPGTAELQGIAAMEALATGLPIIAARAVALPELARDGENGFLYSHGNIAELSDKIVKMTSDKKSREAMSKKSLEIILRHDIKNVIDKFEKLYKTHLALK